MEYEINKRIKIIREKLNLNQDDFAKKIDLSRNAITQFETNRRNPSDRTLKDIANAFNVDYFWLRDGTGEIFSQFPDSIIDDLVIEFNLSELDRRIIEKFLKLDANKRNSFTELMQTIFQ